MSNSFQEAVGYLLSLGNEVLAMKLGLENIRKLLDALDRPQDKYTKVQVAGTNGKGSVCAFVNSICVAAGIRVGMFTSPHLISITERVQINGTEISEDDFARLSTRVRETSERLVEAGELENIPTFFEQVTAIALLAFAEANVEVAILETGLGGRLDATTAADADICAITRIDLDHQQYLGETIEEIAAEKAAIIQRDTQNVVIGEQRPEALRVVLERCKQVGIRDLDWEPHLRWTVDAVSSLKVKVATTRHVFSDIELGLRGAHQRENAETAINVVRILRYDFALGISDENVLAGLAAARHAGRLESIGRFLLDGAHNPGGAQALRDYLDEFVRGPITMIFGSMNDKDAREILSILCARAQRVILTRADSLRSSPPESLVECLPE
ncbi:MAG TPA: folylpolyglutamate synthase/dihydrofolate synthase family protein, partial [Pyrinomonadaceae bacterium]|nr:folylpolyglutamate synthase/dihydrofolate synthase family protein [Pyrinomonadaceae bacterium]